METEDNFYGVLPEELQEILGTSFVRPNKINKHKQQNKEDTDSDNTAVLQHTGIFTPSAIGPAVDLKNDSDLR